MKDKDTIKVKELTTTRMALGLFGGHMGGIVIALMFCFGLAGLMTTTIGLILSEILVLFIYSLTVYSTMWEYGHRDLNKFNYGHIKRDKYRGFKISLIANIPFFVLSILFILSKFGLFYNVVILFKLLNAEIWPLTNLIQQSANMNNFAVWQVFLVALLPIIPVFIEGGAYILGNNDYSPLQNIVYKKKKKPNPPNQPPTIKSKY